MRSYFINRPAVLVIDILAMFLVGLLASYQYFKAVSLSNKSTTLDFCFGQDQRPVVPVTLEDQVQGMRLKNNLVIQLMFLMIVRVLIYVFLYIDIYNQNESMKGVITKKSLQLRKQGNAISLAGQMICFGVEIVTVFLVLFLINFSHSFSLLGDKNIPSIVVVPIQAPLVSLTLILTSPELMKHVKRYI